MIGLVRVRDVLYAWPKAADTLRHSLPCYRLFGRSVPSCLGSVSERLAARLWYGGRGCFAALGGPMFHQVNFRDQDHLARWPVRRVISGRVFA